MPRPRSVVLVLLLAVVAALVVAHGQVLRAVGWALVEETPLEPADVVVLAYNSPTTAATAAEIVKAGHVHRVVIFVPPPGPDDRVLARLGIRAPAEHDLAVEVLRRMGVPRDAVVLDRTVLTGTNDVVRAIARHVETHGLHRVVVVTYRSHTRRTAVLLRRRLGRGAVVIVRAAPSDPYHPDRWWRERESARETMSEALRWINSFFLGDLWHASSHPSATEAPTR